MRSRGWLQGPCLQQRADELRQLHHFLLAPHHEMQADPARPPRALRHRGGASSSFKGRRDAHGSSCPWGPGHVGPVGHPHSACSQGPSRSLLMAGACPQALCSPSPSPQCRGGCHLCPVGRGWGWRVSLTWHPHPLATALGSAVLGSAPLDHPPAGAAIASGRAAARLPTTRGGSSEGTGAPLPTSSYGLCSVSDRYVGIKLQ